MSTYLQLIYNELSLVAQRIKTELKAEDVDAFAKIMNRTVPDKNCEDGIRHDEFRAIFNANDRNKKMIITTLKESKGKRIDLSSRILWTSAYFIVKEFELEDIIFLDWQPKINMFVVGLRKQIEGVVDPIKEGHMFEYYFDKVEQVETPQYYREPYQNKTPNNQDRAKFVAYQSNNGPNKGPQNQRNEGIPQQRNEGGHSRNEEHGWTKNTRNRGRKNK